MRIYGIRHIKIKVGIQGYDDVRRLHTARRWGGRSIDLRVDANEAWTPAEAVERIRELQLFRVTSIEQPLRHEDLSLLADIRRDQKSA